MYDKWDSSFFNDYTEFFFSLQVSFHYTLHNNKLLDSSDSDAVANSGQQAEQNIAEHNQSNDMTESSDQSNYMTESSMFHINYSDIPLPPTQVNLHFW